MEDVDDLEMDYGVDWRAYIHSDPNILVGKPVVKGTRLSVELLLGLAAAGWSEDKMLENYPTLTREGLRSAFAYAAESLSGRRSEAAAR